LTGSKTVSQTAERDAREALRHAICAVEEAPVSAPAQFIADALVKKFPACAILFYGSGNSVSAHENPGDILFDFYVIGESYETLYPSRLHRIANRLIPPNVFYWEETTPFGVLRAKYAVLSLTHFQKLAAPSTFHSYFWARFAQPSRIINAPGAMKEALRDCLAQAATTFCVAAAGLISPPFSAGDLWRTGLGASYRAELRAENPDRVRRLVESYGDWPERITAPALTLGGVPCSRDPAGELTLASAAKRTGAAWRLRAIAGGALSVIRLLKATQTFDGGVDYIVWKIKRHSGIDVPVKDWERRHSLIAAPFVAARYYRLRAKHARQSH